MFLQISFHRKEHSSEDTIPISLPSPPDEQNRTVLNVNSAKKKKNNGATPVLTKNLADVHCSHELKIDLRNLYSCAFSQLLVISSSLLVCSCKVSELQQISRASMAGTTPELASRDDTVAQSSSNSLTPICSAVPRLLSGFFPYSFIFDVTVTHFPILAFSQILICHSPLLHFSFLLPFLSYDEIKNEHIWKEQIQLLQP